MKIAQINTGFSEVPNKISLNIFVQGCSLNCPGCQNPELHDPTGGEEFSPNEILNIIKNKSFFNYVCWLGGEPLQQLEDLVASNKLLTPIYKNVACYTGYYLNEILDPKLFNQDLITEFLDNITLLKCGRWNGNVLGTKDSNQKFFYIINGNPILREEKLKC